MDTNALLEQLGYKDSPFFLQGKALLDDPGYSHVFRRAQGSDSNEKSCSLIGVYALRQRDPESSNKGTIIPTVYVCKADNEAHAEKIHKRVWNQNVVPYLIVVTRKSFRLYPGFEYDPNLSDDERVLKVAKDANEVLSKFYALTAESIDSGKIWEKERISTERRVDRHLLANLKKLSVVLTDASGDYKLTIEHAHSLIGKYIYLRYLKDRGILSADNFANADVEEGHVFGRGAQKDKLYKLQTFLDGFLNGSVFPLPSRKHIQTKHVGKVASVFIGDDPESGQQVLFDAYDFSYIPIETLSVVYQQFLHEKDDGKQKGAYYTPVHLVNFILDELEAKKSFEEGMKVFDPSCGSGAFLVQCYRRLVEKVLRKEGKLKPTRLRGLLVKHIFGLDADEEACRVAELSLSLTLLDYIEPKDLSTYPTFQLPKLHNKNIFHCEGGFFDEKSLWVESIPKDGYDWIVGNPPWKNVKKKEEEDEEEKLYDRKAIDWIDDNKKMCPVDNYQSAEAFAWKTKELLTEDGQCGLILPAMTLFKKQGDKFRCSFFSQVEVWCIVNFANIRRYLFAGAINPAAAFFFSGKREWDRALHHITTYAPFAVEQAGQLNEKDKSKMMFAVFVNYTSIKELPLRDIVHGASVPWKMAMWGLIRDSRYITTLSERYDDLFSFKERCDLKMHQGPEFRSLPIDVDANARKKFLSNHVYHQEYIGKRYVDVDNIPSECFKLPDTAFETYGEDDTYLRIRGGTAGLKLYEPPHLIISASRKFSVFSDIDFMIPPRQIGIAGDSTQTPLLKALALYLKSELVKYQQWLTSATWGVERDRPNLDDLKKLPVALSSLSEDELTEWAQLHDEIVDAEKAEREAQANESTPLFRSSKRSCSTPLNDLLKRMNNTVYKLLGIGRKQRWLIEDTVNVRMKLNDGVFNAKEAVKAASKKEIVEFARIFQEELDLFLDHDGRRKVHKVKVLYADRSAVMIVDHLKRSTATAPKVVAVEDSKVRQELNDLQARLRETGRNQWMYFTRCLRVYEGRRTYIFKPRERLYWLKSQGLAEADEFIEEKVAQQ